MPVEISGRWQLDNNAVNSVNGTFGTVNGNPTYLYGPQGKAINLNPADGVDYLDLPYSQPPSFHHFDLGQPHRHLRRQSHLADRGQQRALEQLRINADGKFEYYLQSLDTPGTGAITQHQLTGTTIAKPGQWYHIVGVSQNHGSMRLYVNGQEEGTSQSIIQMVPGADRFHVGDASSTGTPCLHFTGQVDDIRVSDRPLSATNVSAQSTTKSRPNAMATGLLIAISPMRLPARRLALAAARRPTISRHVWQCHQFRRCR